MENGNQRTSTRTAASAPRSAQGVNAPNRRCRSAETNESDFGRSVSGQDGIERVHRDQVSREDDLLRAVEAVVEHGIDKERGDAPVEAIESDDEPEEAREEQPESGAVAGGIARVSVPVVDTGRAFEPEVAVVVKSRTHVIEKAREVGVPVRSSPR